jgi:hypothetical protein
MIHIALQVLLLIALPFLPLQRILMAIAPILILSTTRNITRKQESLLKANTALALINEKDQFAIWAKQRFLI